MNAKRKIIIDCDTGIDDALALMLALASPELEVIGITAVCGNVPVDIGVENIRKVLNVMNRLDIPVYRGEEKPLRREYISAQDTHGMDGLGESGYENVPGSAQEKDAVSYITDTLREKQGVSIIAIGPLTNIAKALQKDLEAFEQLDEFVSMGGSYKSHGNCSPVAEYNYWCDPDAAKYVYENLSSSSGTRFPHESGYILDERNLFQSSCADLPYRPEEMSRHCPVRSSTHHLR